MPKVPEARVRAVLDLLSVPDGPNPFGVELSGVRLEADDMDWSLGEGDVVSGAGQALVLVSADEHLPDGRVARRGAAPSVGAERLEELAGHQTGRCGDMAACSTGNGRPVRPVAQGGSPGGDAGRSRPGGPTR